MKKRQVLINAIISVMQIIAVSLLIFILYRYLLNTIGIKLLGIWSLVLATTSITQIANFGLSGSVVKFVAKYIARGEDENVSDVIQTATLSAAVIISVILLIGYPVIKWIVGIVVPKEFLYHAIIILPYALLTFWLMMITGIFHAGLDGFQRIDLRSILLIVGTALHLLLCFVLVPAYGLLGVAYAQVIQGLVILISSWLFLKKCLPSLPIIPHRWKKEIFKEISCYGINFQIISIAVVFYDPITKGLLSKFGSLAMVGYYEMVSKMIQQFRALIVSANQVLVPAIADLHERNPEMIKDVYLTSYRLLFYLLLPLYSMIIVCTPIISELWIGYAEEVFILFSILLTIGWFFNTLSVPAYFAYLGIGELRWNVAGHIMIGLLNVGSGFLLGTFYGGTGIVIAWVSALSLGSIMIHLSYHIKNRIPFAELLPKASRIITLVCIVGIFITLKTYYTFNHSVNTNILYGINLVSFSIIVVILLWFHPMRKSLIGWVSSEILNRKTEVDSRKKIR
jgi:O-antigen/teichoic acid export membrane protein